MLRFILVLLTLGISTVASAHDIHIVERPQPYYYERPHQRSILAHGVRGTFSGALVGLGASYFVAQIGDDAWRTVGMSVSIGALSGAALGLTLGVFDQMDFPGAYYVSRDLSWGTLFGAMLGAIGGGIACIGGADGEAVLIGAAAGSLGGFGLGLLTGIVEGQYRVHHQPMVFGDRMRLRVAQIAADSRAWGVRVQGRF